MAGLTVTSIDDFTSRTFDFLVIGGGTAGLIVASRLAEDGKFTVGVVEAGSQLEAKDEDRFLIPAYSVSALGSPHDWAYKTVAQTGCNDRCIKLTQGKILGGSSQFNFMVWGRGAKEDYDAWEALGNPGWGWDGLLPFFKKSETFHPPRGELRQSIGYSHDPKSYGDSGPIQVSVSPAFPETHLYWHKTFHNLGFETNDDPAGGSNVGVSTIPSSIDPIAGTRCPSTRYPLASPNLFILTGALVNEIVLSQHDSGKEPIASGVRFTHQGKEHVVSASREVVLSAGAIKSPHILELSGIGNPEILGKVGIPLKVNSPMVGENFQDHARLSTTFEMGSDRPQTKDIYSNLAYAAAAREQYAKDKTGPLTHVLYSLCFLPFAKIMSNDALENMAMKAEALAISPPEKKTILSRRLTERAHVGQMEYILDPGSGAPNYPAEEGKKYGNLMQIVQYPFSVGSVHVRPGNGSKPKAEDAPLIDPGYYAGPHGELDLEAMSEALEFSHKLLNTAPLADLVEKIVHPSAETIASKDLRKQWIGQNTQTTWHPLGTCSMGGKEGIRGGVVDERLRVYGVKRLRIVDASIMPLEISAHLQATVYAIGEKGVHMILEDHGRGVGETY